MSKRYSRPEFANDLEVKRPLFLLSGLVIALTAVFMAFELKFEKRKTIDFASNAMVEEQVIEIVPITRTAQRAEMLPVKQPASPIIDPSTFVVVSNTQDLPGLEFSSLLNTVDTLPAPIWDPGEDLGDEVFTFLEVENRPIFPGCESLITDDERFKCFNSSLMAHINREFELPEHVKSFNLSEKLYVEFIIEKDGSIKEAKILRGEDHGLKSEALRVINALPTFKPGTLNGKPVRMSYILPINIQTF